MKRSRPREMNEFVDRLRAVFGAEPVTAVARRLGIDQPAMTRYLHGEIAPGYNFFSKAAKTGIDTNWLLTGHAVKKQRGIRCSRKQSEILFQISLQISQLKKSVEID